MRKNCKIIGQNCHKKTFNFSCVCQAAVTAVFAQFAICLRLCHKYMTLGSFFLQFSHNKYAILSYKGEEKRITSETLHSTDLLPFVCSPIFPDLSHYDYFSKSLRRFSCHHTVTRTPHKGLELLSIQITKKLFFFLIGSNESTFSNFSCMFLNPNIFFQFEL